ncbi:MAG TPA: putative nucleotidyltransferase substrate binding domain-containing protein [Paracoccaceae bacterium]|nr:putative nucleotidyltransferase substrate binding domain-containing protein [Paracoccaceae bacterium]
MPDSTEPCPPPFACLGPADRARVEATLEPVQLPAGSLVLQAGERPKWFWLVEEGSVEVRSSGAVIELCLPGDGFDAGMLISPESRHDFVVRDPVRLQRMPAAVFLDLADADPSLARHYLAALAQRMRAWSESGIASGLLGAMPARVTDAALLPPGTVPSDLTIREASLRMEAEGRRALLIEEDGRIGIVSEADIARALARENRPLATPIADIARFDLVEIAAEEPLADAALTMAERHIRHLVVRRGNERVGLLDAAAVLASLGARTEAIAAAIDRARHPEDLAPVADQVVSLVRQLSARGAGITIVTRLASELNARIAARLWNLIAGPELVRRSCLILMGSEGRGEQILRTDQDNGLILDDGPAPDDFPAITARFTEAMIACGFPACPGEIMVRNPAWAKPLAAWKADLRDWVRAPSDETLMHMAIFADAAAIAGDTGLLERTRALLRELLRDNPAYIRHFVRAAERFEIPLGLLNRLVTTGGRIDVKKGGIFQIVHGIRSLALEAGLEETGTLPRLRRLAEAGTLDRRTAADLEAAFTTLLGLRLRHRVDQLRRGETPDDRLDPSDFGRLERDALRDSLLVAKHFREILRHRYQLGLMT